MRYVHLLLVGLLVVATVGCTAGSAARGDPGYTVSLESQPTPMQSGRVATVSVRVTQADGAPLTGATVSFVAEHTGMSMGKGTVATQERAPGVYGGEYIPPMAGTYRLTVKVEGPQGQVERVLEASAR